MAETTKKNHPKGWKRNYKFPNQASAVAEKAERIKHLESAEHRYCMMAIREWNAKMHGETDV